MWRGITCPTDISILSPQSFTPSEFKRMFDEQMKEMETELEVYMNYKMYTAPTKKETLEQYAALFFYKGKAYIKNALLTDSQRYANKVNTFIDAPVTHDKPNIPELDEYLTEDIVEEKKKFEDINFVFNKTKHNPLVIGISTQSIRNITGYSYTPVPEWSTT